MKEGPVEEKIEQDEGEEVRVTKRENRERICGRLIRLVAFYTQEPEAILRSANLRLARCLPRLFTRQLASNIKRLPHFVI